jgi:LPXTG-site transpeptidase (sortase) family protein
MLIWALVTVRFGDPITSAYTRYEQHRLSHELAQLNREWAGPHPSAMQVANGGPARPVAYRTATATAATPQSANKPKTAKKTAGARKASPGVAKLAAKKRALKKKALLAKAKKTLERRATVFGRRLREEQAIGRIVIPKLSLRMVVVEGTSEGSLRKGPGHYNALTGEKTDLPGMGGTVAIAGHRTTYLRPFRYIDTLRPGDKIWLVMPYGQFAYTVYAHRIVTPSDWSILRDRPYEKLVLSACNPLYSAAQRWVVFARLTGMSPAAA